MNFSSCVTQENFIMDDKHLKLKDDLCVQFDNSKSIEQESTTSFLSNEKLFVRLKEFGALTGSDNHHLWDVKITTSHDLPVEKQSSLNEEDNFFKILTMEAPNIKETEKLRDELVCLESDLKDSVATLALLKNDFRRVSQILQQSRKSKN